MCSACRKFTTTRWLLAIAILALCIVAPQITFAQNIQMSSGVAYPTPVLVGTTNVPVSINAANDSSLGGGYPTQIDISLTQMVHQVSCTNNSQPCTVPENPPVFQIVGCPLAAPANVTCTTATGDAGSKCAGVTFNIQPTGTSGEYRFLPTTPVILSLDSTPTDLERRCTVSFLVNAINFPQIDSNGFAPDGFQTNQVNGSNGVVAGGPNDTQLVSATGPDTTTIYACPPATQCRAALGVCDTPEICTAVGLCPAEGGRLPSTTQCAAATGECNLPASCDGILPTCPANPFKPSTTACGTAPTGECGLPSSCTGSSATCPPNPFKPSTTACGTAPTGECGLPSSCTGTSQVCPPNPVKPSTTACGSAPGECGLPASCDGVTQTCPANGFKPSTTACGSAPTGECGLPASCTGTSQVCPPNPFKPSTTACGSAPTGECGLPASCTGSSQVCPPNPFKPSTTACGPGATGACDLPASCTGTSQVCPPNPFKPATTACSAELCESCNGTSAACPTTNLCTLEACRTPGYWAQHGGQEKTNSTNQTNLVIASVGSISVCGQTIIPFLGAGNTGVDHQGSAIEALCMPNGGDFRSQVVFHLTAAILNCVANNPANVGCVGDPLFGPIVAACNTASVCAPTTASTKAAQAACVSALDCLNNGGHVATVGGACTFNSDNCHNRNFPNFPDSPAGSQDACKAATKNDCTIFGGCSFNP